jgi:hypothetical protein
MEKNLSERAKELADHAEYIYKEWDDWAPSVDVGREITIDFDISKWIMSCENFLTFACMPQFLESFKALIGDGCWDNKEENKFKILRLAGIMSSAQEELEKGFIGSIRHDVDAEVFDSLYLEADGLFRKGHYLTTAILGRVILERWLRDISEKMGIETKREDKLKDINDKLLENGKISQSKYKLIKYFVLLGNTAVHSQQDDNIKSDDVKNMLEFIRVNCI